VAKLISVRREGYIALLSAAARQLAASIAFGSAMIVVLATFVDLTSGLASHFGEATKATTGLQPIMGELPITYFAVVAMSILLILGMTATKNGTSAKRSFNIVRALGFPANLSGDYNPVPGSVAAALGGLAFLGLAVLLVATQVGYQGGWFEASAPPQAPATAVILVGAVATVLFSQNAYAARHTIDADAATAWDERAWVIWLRSFRDDRVRLPLSIVEMPLRLIAPLLPWGQLEGLVVAHCSAIGPVIALGRPDDKQRPSGAFREYLDGESWQEHLQDRLDDASAIVHCYDQTPGTEFEYDLLINSPALRSRTLFIFHPRLSSDVRRKTLATLPGQANNACSDAIAFFFERPNSVVIFIDKRRWFGSYADVLNKFCASLGARRVPQ